MIGLRKLLGIALVAGLFAALAGCGKGKGDLGAEREESAPVVRNEPVQAPAASTNENSGVAADAPAVVAANPQEPVAEAVELAPNASSISKEIRAENVNLDRPADRLTGHEGETARASDPIVAQVGDEPAPPAPAAEPAPAPAPVPEPVPAPAPVEETPQQRAERLLSEAQRLNDVKTQAGLAEADAAYQAGLKLFNDLEYEQAKSYFERAVALDPTHAAAKDKLRITNALLGVHVDRIGAKIRELEQAERVKMQESVLVLANAMEEARALEERGSETVTEANPEEKEEKLASQLDQIKRAQDRYRRVREIINWMPPTFDLPGARQQVDAALVRVRTKIAEKEDEISFLRRTQASKAADNARLRESELFKARIRKMLDQVRDLYDKKQYREAERLAVRVLTIDPMNSDAEGWKSKSRSAYHSMERADMSTDLHEETLRAWEDVDAATIGYAPLITYPPNWDQISKRSDTAVGRQVKEESWKADIRKKLQRKVTFDFTDTPFEEAIRFLRDLAGVTMIIDPRVVAGGALPPVNLRVTDMNLEQALDWILKSADLKYALKDNAVFISKEQNLTEDVELRIYDVSDLIQAVHDFPGPDLQLTTPDELGGGAPPPTDPFGAAAGGAAATPTLTNIADMIRTRVRPESWDAALHTSIQEVGGKLVVMQRPEIHALVDQLLSNFRKTQKMMINIESRFLTIREAYLEDIGVEFQGLDPNVLFGDFGDIRRLAAPTGLVQPRIPGGTDSTPPNAPFPGFTNGPDRFLNGSFSQVGSIVNHTIGFFDNDPDTISGLDDNNNVRQGGFSGQITVLNNAQVQAFVRALAVRENQSTLVAPRLTVFNTQRAHMFIARQQSYVGDYNISGDSYDPVIRQFLVGVVLDVKPIVSSDRRYVTLELRPTVTDLVNFATRQIDSFTINTGANGNTLTIPLSFPIQFPELSIRRVRTTATVPDGGILLIGGLYRNVKFNAENGVPFLSDLPVVGRFFRWNTVDNAKTNLAILVSPRIILFSEEEEKL